MKHFIVLYVVAVLVVSGISCKKSFLDVKDNGVILLQQYVKDIKTASQYFNSIYLNLGNLYAEYSYIYPELAADNIKPRTTNYIAHYNWSQFSDATEAATGKNCDSYWLSAYKLIRICSFTLKKAQEFRSDNPSGADDLMAQAYAIRALMHFNLVNIFAQAYNFTSDGSHPGVPYVTTDDWSQPVSRQTVAEVYAGILSDLNNAIPLFAANPSNTLYFNINAAKALLARAYLFKGEYANAKNTAISVLSAKPIMIGASYPSKLFTKEETEALFQIPPSWININGGTYSLRLAAIYFSTLYQFNATADISLMLTENPQDVRSAWVSAQGPGIWNITKFPKNVEPGFPAGGTMSYYQTVFRSSEMCLTAAECLAKLNKEDSAKYYLDAIRLRANPSLSPSYATGIDLLDSIYMERRKELSFESLRMFDILRWKQNVNRKDANSGSPSVLPYPSDKAIAPIPMNDVRLSGLPQNPSY